MLFADELIMNSPCPLLVVRAPKDMPNWQPRCILVPTTGVMPSIHAAELAVAIARSTGVRVTALYVVERQREMLFWLDRQRKQAEELAREVVAQVATLGEPFGVEVNTIVRTAARAAPEIVRVAQQVNADLVLLSGSPRPTQRLFLGHTVGYVLSHARCAAAVIKS
jgi:nucleotide-binding universal stress UspA family protein